jgi:hypothetical protein
MRRIVLALLVLSAGISTARTQTPPSPGEIARFTGLHAAAHHGIVSEIVQQIVNGADPNMRDGNGRTPLLVAAFAKRRDVMRALVKGGADPRARDNQNYDAITIAAVADDVETLKVAIEIGGDPKAITSPYAGTALIAAAHLGHDGIVAALIRAGAPLDHVNNLHWTALIEAVILGDGGRRHIECVRLLVAAGANRNLADKDGVTPLEHARRRGYAEMVRLLQ